MLIAVSAYGTQITVPGRVFPGLIGWYTPLFMNSWEQIDNYAFKNFGDNPTIKGLKLTRIWTGYEATLFIFTPKAR